ncbi:MAG TPA: pirin family protein [Steroidobacteraceae bacterium]|nr:pirin family protein [Steroidobacteraceae bacterium]
MLKLPGHEKDLGGGLRVSRLLPSFGRRTIGPFVFMDHFGPLIVAPQMNIDVRPHPHIGLATVTYLFDGAIMHRDSLGSAQRIAPGAINWMSAGGGIVHSERTPEDLRAVSHALHGLQLWVGLPQALEESAPRFTHASAEELAAFPMESAEIRVLVGEAFGHASPVEAASPTLFLSLRLRARKPFRLPVLAAEMAVYPVEHDIRVEGTALGVHTLGVLPNTQGHRLDCAEDCTVVVIGGAPLEGPRFLLWNFVSSSKARLRQAAEDWQEQRMPTVAGDPERIPLPRNLPIL